MPPFQNTPVGGPPPELTHATCRVDFALPATTEAVAEARRCVRYFLGAWHAAETGDTAALVVSELFTNAVTHTDSSSVVCVLAVTERQVLIQVEDHGTRPSALTAQHVPLHEERGRGLLLVDAVSQHWGATRSEGGSGLVVWATLNAAPE